MATYIPEALRRAIIARANGCCEYCGKPQVSFFPHEVDHVIAQKHGGKTALDNLAFTCFECNRYKGSDIASFDPQTGQLSALFNPRTQAWDEHFRYDKSVIIPLTAEGRTTTILLHFNDLLRVQERIALHIGMSQS